MSHSLSSIFKKKIATEPVLGPFMKTCDPAFVEAAGLASMDFVILDMEHGPISLEHMQNNIRSAQVAEVLPIVRVPALNEVAIAQALDIGAAGVQIPHVSTAEEARLAVRAAKFYPLGGRGTCRFVRAAGYGSVPKGDYFSRANEETIIIAQLEGQEAIANLESIMAVPGLDILFIGPYDLSQSLGLPGQTSHERVVEQMQYIINRAAERGLLTGTFTDSTETMELWLRAGVRYLAYSVDVGIFYEACAGLTARFKSFLS